MSKRKGKKRKSPSEILQDINEVRGRRNKPIGKKGKDELPGIRRVLEHGKAARARGLHIAGTERKKKDRGTWIKFQPKKRT